MPHIFWQAFIYNFVRFLMHEDPALPEAQNTFEGF